MRKKLLYLFIVTIFAAPLLVIPLTANQYDPPKDIFVHVAILLCLLLWIKYTLTQNKIEIQTSRFYFVISAFLLLAALSFAWSENIYYAKRELFRYFILAVAFFIAANAIRAKEIKYVVGVAFAAGCISGLYALSQYFGFDFAQISDADITDWKFHIHSTFSNPHFLANYLILVFPVGVTLYLSSARIVHKLSLLFAINIVYAAILVTFSAGALTGLACGVGFAVFFFAYDLFRGKSFFVNQGVLAKIKAGTVVLCVSLVLVTAFFISTNAYLPRSIFKQAKISAMWSSNLQNRFTVDKDALRIVRDKPLLGIGLGNFKYKFPSSRTQAYTPQSKEDNADAFRRGGPTNALNQFILIWVELGIFGAIISALIIIMIFKYGLYLIYETTGDFKRKGLVLGIMGGLFGFLTQCSVSSPFQSTPNALLFWVFSGLIFSMLPHGKKVIELLDISLAHKTIIRAVSTICIALLCIWTARFYVSDVFLKKATESDRQGLITRASAEAATALFFNSDSPAVIYAGNYAFMDENYKTAADLYMKAIKNYDTADIHLALAQVYYKENLIGDCINEYREALRLDPLSSGVRLKLAKIYAENDMDDEAKAECKFMMMHNSHNEALMDEVKRITRDIYNKEIYNFTHGEF